MTLELLYWILMLLWLLGGIWLGLRPVEGGGGRYWWGATGLLFLLFLVIGLKIFGSPLKG